MRAEQFDLPAGRTDPGKPLQWAILMSIDTLLLQRLYALFNVREMESVLKTMHEDVVWANGMDGGHVQGCDGVIGFCTR